MGMDLITAILYTEKDASLDWEAGEKAISTLDLSSGQGDFAYEVYGDSYLWNDEGTDIVDPEEKREFLDCILGCLEDVKHSIESYDRHMNMVEIENLTLYIFGFSSYGDAPEVFDSIMAIDCFPQILKAVGFKVNE